jgi:PAS domain S-box-containing protein
MKAIDIMTKNPVFLKERDTIRHAAQVLEKEDIEAAPVLDESNRPTGLFSKTHLLRVINEKLPATLPVRQVMTAPVQTFNTDTLLGEITARDEIPPLFPITDNGGRLTGVITRQQIHRTLQTQLEQTGDKLDTLLEFSYNGIIAVDADCLVTTWNPAFERMSGIKKEDALGRYLPDILPGGKLHVVLETGESMYGQKIQLGDSLVISNRTPIIKNGKIEGAISVCQDISSLESIGAELKVTNELNKELDAIIDSVYEGLYITDGEANTLRINKAYTRMTGIRPEEVIGKNMKDLVERGIYSESVTLHVLERKEPVTILHQIKGTQKCLITGNPIFNDRNEIIRVVTTVRDVTELNKLEKKLEAVEDISQKYHMEVQHLRQQQMKQTDLIEHSAAMRKVLALAYKAAQVDSTVLISGPTGVGKEMIAKFIHKNSPRGSAPFINVNCAAIPESLLESELFGYEKGAFTGAQSGGKPGMFELADSGTIFLDEIGDLPHNLQAKLLLVLQDKAVLRIGGTRSKQLDVRILAASNLELEKLVSEGAFRQDLYYRLNVIPVVVPPLSVRKEEIPYLAKHFLELYNERHGQKKQFGESAMDVLMQHNWPGNVRELKNLVERLVVIGNEDVIRRDQIFGLGEAAPPAMPSLPTGTRVLLKDAVSALEKQLISNALTEEGSTRKAARCLGVSQPTVIRKAKRYGIRLGGGDEALKE